VSPEQTRQGTPTHRCDAEDAEIVVPKVLAGATLGGRSVHSIKTDDRQVEQRLNADYRKAIAKR
jgi:hypothetical protein